MENHAGSVGIVAKRRWREMTENHFADAPMGERELSERWHKPEDLTCFDCECRDTCPFVDDWWNTHGDCLALK